MHVTVRLFATFREGRFNSEEWDRPERTTVREILGELGIEPKEVGVVLVNGRHADYERALVDGDVLSILPWVGGG